jgi:hypothetical protein
LLIPRGVGGTQINPGTKTTPGTREYHRPNVVVVTQILTGLYETFTQLWIQGVKPMRSIEGQDDDPLASLDE